MTASNAVLSDTHADPLADVLADIYGLLLADLDSWVALLQRMIAAAPVAGSEDDFFQPE